MKTLQLSIENLRSIKELTLTLPLNPGLYAITGKNGSGKSTAMAAIASLFYFDILEKYFFNSVENNSQILYKYNYSDKTIDYSFSFDNTKNKWNRDGRKIYLHGFYEGSLIHGNRFRDSYLKALKAASRIKESELIESKPEIRKMLGFILHDDEEKYKNLKKLPSDRAKAIFKFRSSPYFLIKNSRPISQLSLSTGENLLLSLLHSIYTHIQKRIGREDEYFILLDEVELALHPSALLRLLDFLEQLSSKHKIAIYFSTHSTDLIRKIKPNNIFFLNKHIDNTVEVINPCYPAYATRNIYMHDGYDYLILVEDILAKKIVNWILRKENLLSSKLIHILPAGGWNNVIALHKEIMASNFLGAGKKAFTILDGDVEDEFNTKYKDKSLVKNLNIDFLPIESAEKYLKKKLHTKIDHKFFRHFNDMFFHKTSLDDIMQEYNKKYKNDKNGKKLLSIIEQELQKNNTRYEDFTDKIVEYIVDNENMGNLSLKIKKIFNH